MHLRLAYWVRFLTVFIHVVFTINGKLYLITPRTPQATKFITLVLIIASYIAFEFGILDIAKAQVGASSSAVTPQTRSAMCDPNNPKLAFVNTTESHICGLPKSLKTNATATNPTETVLP